MDPDPYLDSLEMLDPGPCPKSINPDPQLWFRMSVHMGPRC
jgi:hypothetical protein